jgi:hypothetical protein
MTATSSHLRILARILASQPRHAHNAWHVNERALSSSAKVRLPRSCWPLTSSSQLCRTVKYEFRLLHILSSCMAPSMLRGISPRPWRLQSATLYRNSFLSASHSLEHERGEVQYPAALESRALGRALLTLVGAYSRKQQLSNGTCRSPDT